MLQSVFISHADEDRSVATTIHDRLLGNGVACFLAEKHIRIAEDITTAVAENLLKSTIVVVVLSPAAMISQWVMIEIGQAMAMRKKIIPFLTHIRQTVPDVLYNTKHAIDIDELVEYIAVEVREFAEKTNPLQKGTVSNVPEEPKPPIDFPYIRKLKRSNIMLMKVPGLEQDYSSFEPSNSPDYFLQLKVPSTKGWLPTRDSSRPFVETDNFVTLICDPIRPFEIQIGRNRRERLSANMKNIDWDDDFGLNDLKRLYPMIIDDNHRWMRAVIAELSNSPDVLGYIYDNEPDPFVKALATKNPYADEELKSKGCLFCSKEFVHTRTVFSYKSARIIHNDYPYGPFFHYIVFPEKGIHCWENVDEACLVDMNMAIKLFFDGEKGDLSLGGTSGMRIGLNSSVRHLVAGKATSTAAGASIPHIHKQVWGMAVSSFNLGDYLCQVCDAYEKIGIDYLDEYLKCLEKFEFVIWQDNYAALYIPFGQISAHELQIMVKRKGSGTYLDLSEEEIKSLSRAEFIATRIYSELEVNSFNEVVLMKTFYRSKSNNFRLIVTFMTREVDLAVSELNLVYVVDQHPVDTRIEIRKLWPSINLQYGFGGESAFSGLEDDQP